MIRAAFASTRLRLARFRDDERGVALIEFAFAVPILTLLFVGGYQLSDALFAYRKVTLATRTISDLTSRFTKVSDVDLDIILNASQQVMSPYSPSAAAMTVSQIDIDAGGKSTVSWSRGKNTSKLATNSVFDLPAAMKQPNTSLIVSQIVYTYRPGIASNVFGAFAIKEQMIMSPRASQTIVLDNT
ncbi:TadE/TadG family type IV pilus assembly protein [uncultured Sphingomonas sp.]|uniref:TadE/TadG family type IV pilus assembly protein n=1 Tax=uncultured Sphingomonas sp. TaxID=158754 RepID=UPI0035CBD4FD